MAPPVIHFPWPEKALPAIRSAGRFPLPLTPAELGKRTREYVCPTVAIHQHDYAGEWTIRGHRLELRPGDVTLTPAGERNWYELDHAGHHLCIHFDSAPSGAHPLGLPLLFHPGAEVLPLAERFQQIISLHRQSLDGQERAGAAARAASAALHALLLWIGWLATGDQRNRAPIPHPTDQTLERLRRVLDERYREPWSAMALAQEARLSPNYLARMFRRKFGVTLQQYLFQRRIECARHLLSATSEPIKGIAAECGFGTAQYFCRRFRMAVGLPPSTARRGYAALFTGGRSGIGAPIPPIRN